MLPEENPPTIGLATFARLRRGERFTLATGGGFVALQESEPEDPTGAPAEPPAPRQLDAFEIIEPLGEGGMGVVYLAQQLEPVRRRVALKVLKSAIVDPKAALRFQAERQAMAQLAHPFVAQVYGAGANDEGHPYFVMEHVEGQPITRYCDAKRLTFAHRLALMRDVCLGVQHAHQKGILHRDLKPSNILVAELDGQPVPKIIDFGIATGLDEPLLDAHLPTEAGLIGTPGYFSPEMVRGEGDADTRSDVYALGILLYELLVGRRPFDGGETSVFEVLRRIVSEHPMPPSQQWDAFPAERRSMIAAARRLDAATLPRHLRGDLDAMVLKAIALDRQARYDTAAALADDIGRYLHHEPVEARAAGGWYRLRKLVRRHRGPAIAAALLVAALATGLLLRTVEARRANREAEAARQITSFLVEMFENADPIGEGGAHVTARTLLDQGAEQVRTALVDQPLIRAQLLDTIGTVYRHLGVYEESVGLTEEALALRRAHRPADHADVAASAENLAISYIRGGRYAEAKALLLDVIARHERRFGPNALALAVPLTQLGRAVGNQGSAEDAAAYFERALAIQTNHLGDDDLALAATLSGLAHASQMLARYDEAEAHAQRVVDIRASLLSPDHVLVADALERLANHRLARGRVAEARPALERALRIVEQAYGSDQPEIVATLNSLGSLHTAAGDPEQARALYERAFALGQEHPDIDPIHRMRTLAGLLSVAYFTEDWPACENYALEHHEVVLGTFDPTHSQVAWSFNNLGVCRARLDRFDEAEAAYRASHEIFVATLGPEHPETHSPLLNLAEVMVARQQFDEAEAILKRALAVWEEAYGVDSTDVAIACHSLGELYRQSGRWEAARMHLARTVRIRENAFPPGHWQLRLARKVLADVLRTLGRNDEATSLDRKNAA